MVVSSRRLAREWALRVLYQIDVGKSPPQEVLHTAMEQLRLEFVHRGSRTASGSTAEAVALEFITYDLRDMLPALRLPLERAVTAFVGRIFEEAPYWQEVRLERTFRSRAPGIPFSPPRLLTPLPDSYLLPGPENKADGLAVQIASLTPEERARFLNFTERLRVQLALLLAPEMRKTALAFAKELILALSALPSPQERQDTLHARRAAFNQAAAERFHKVGAMAQKQTADWLRTTAFVHKLVTGVQEHRDALGARISGLSSGWSLERQVAVDRNILRLAAFEILFLPGIPTGASINEAVELAKKYSTTESGRFVNGVLGALAAQVGDKLGVPVADAIEADEQDEAVDLPDITDMEDSETL